MANKNIRKSKSLQSFNTKTLDQFTGHPILTADELISILLQENSIKATAMLSIDSIVVEVF